MRIHILRSPLSQIFAKTNPPRRKRALLQRHEATFGARSAPGQSAQVECKVDFCQNEATGAETRASSNI
jgi:hypothetical protein